MMVFRRLKAREWLARYHAIQSMSSVLGRARAFEQVTNRYVNAQAINVDRRNGSQLADPATRLSADTHLLSEEEIRRHGLGKRPPGSQPGAFMQERSGLRGFTKGELFPVYILLFMVVAALGLGIMTSYRELVLSPTVKVDKRRRRTLSEVDDPEREFSLSDSYTEDSPLRKISMNEEHAPGIVKFNKKLFHEPPHLPGDEKRIVGPKAELVAVKPGTKTQSHT